MLKNNKSIILSTDEMNLQFGNRSILNREVEVETFARKIMKNDRLKKFTITLLGVALFCKDVFAATKGIDALGMTLLALVRQWAKPILILWCIVDVIKNGLSGDSKKILPILLKYIIIFASMYLIPIIFDAIERSFS